MNRILRLLTTASLSGLLAFAATVQGCSNEEIGPPDVGAGPCTDPNDYKTCVCTLKSDCTPDPAQAKYFVCTSQKTCVKICIANSDCASGELCEDSQCRSPGCGADADCNAGQQCVSGKCENKIAASAVTACVVSPSRAIISAGSTKSFQVVAKNADGKAIPYNGDVTWTPGAVGSVTGATAQVTLTGAAAAATGTLAASIGGVTCTPANVTNFAAAEQDAFRVVVANFETQELIQSAKVVVGDTVVETDASGTASFEDVTLPATVSVFSAAHSYVTYVDVNTNDVVVYLKPAVQSGKLKGEFSARTFDNLNDIRGTVHLAINGPSIAGNVLDLSLDTLLGESVDTTIDLGGSTKTTLPLPDGIVIGLADNMFKKTTSIQSTPGLRALWTLGGNVVLSEVMTVVSQASGGDIDVGSILSAVLPLVGKLQASAYAGVEFKAGETGSLPAGFRPEVPLRLRQKIEFPTLPAYKVDGADKRFSETIVLAGALYGNQGLVPLGLTAGIDKDLNGKVDAATMGGTEGEGSLRLAPQNGGIEGSKYVALSLAASLSSLVGSNSSSGPLVLSARVAYPGDILFKDNDKKTIKFGDNASYMIPPETVAIVEGERKLNVSTVAGADLLRLDLENGSKEWQIYFPPTATSVVVPALPEGVTEDRFDGDATLQIVDLKSGLDYQGVLKFDSENADDLTPSITGFVTRGITRAAAQ